VVAGPSREIFYRYFKNFYIYNQIEAIETVLKEWSMWPGCKGMGWELMLTAAISCSDLDLMEIIS
jgi:hypothetical protein